MTTADNATDQAKANVAMAVRSLLATKAPFNFVVLRSEPVRPDRFQPAVFEIRSKICDPFRLFEKAVAQIQMDPHANPKKNTLVCASVSLDGGESVDWSFWIRGWWVPGSEA
jgi:hypothetical protein